MPIQRYFDDLGVQLQKFFELRTQSGDVLKFLGIRIIQSDAVITMDQGEYVFDILEQYFGSDVDKVKTVTTPMRTDSDFEKELFDALPLTDDGLIEATRRFRGSYRFRMAS